MNPLVIGRDGSCDVVLDDSFVSRWHLKLDVEEEGNCRLTDLGSTNGTYVFKDREPFRVIEALLTLADRVKIGNCDYSVRELVSLSCDRRAWAQDTATIKSTEALASQEYLQNQDDAPRRWRSSSTFIFVVGFNATFWLMVLYLVFGL